jgi:hypothetical protein
VGNLRRICNNKLHDVGSLLFYAKFFLFFAYLTNLENIHEGAFYFCHVFKSIGQSKGQIIQWLNMFKEKDPAFNVDFIINKIF